MDGPDVMTYHVEIALLVEEVGHRDDVGAVVGDLDSGQIRIDITCLCAQSHLMGQAATAPVQQDHPFDYIHLFTMDQGSEVVCFCIINSFCCHFYKKNCKAFTMRKCTRRI